MEFSTLIESLNNNKLLLALIYLIMSFIMKLDYGTKYNFAVGSEDTGDLRIADVSGNSVYFYRISDER